MLRALAVLAIAVAGCLQSGTIPCGDGRICPEGKQCEPTFGLCVVPEQLGCVDDGASCSFGTKNGLCRSGVCVELVCGDGVRIGDEECDGNDIGDATCESLHFYETRGPVTCSSHCTYDTSQCAGICGDGVWQEDTFEQCDSADDDTAVVDNCQNHGFYDAGAITCTNLCTMDFAQCTGFCGDGVINGGEFCEEGMAAALAECIDFGFDAGDTSCSDDCSPSFDRCRHIGWRRVATTADPPRDVWIRGDDDYVFATSYGVLRFANGGMAKTMLGSGINDIHGSPNDAWAVGDAGVAAHFDGQGWTTTTTGTGQTLHGVWAASPTNVFAAGTSSTLLRYDGASWQAMASPVSSVLLQAIAGSSGSNVIAVGQNGKAFHFDGAQWEDKPTGTSAHLYDVWVAAADDAWAVGDAGTLLRYDGSQWSIQPSLGAGTMLAVWGRSATDVYAASSTDGLFHYDGGSWWPLVTGANGVSS